MNKVDVAPNCLCLHYTVPVLHSWSRTFTDWTVNDMVEATSEQRLFLLAKTSRWFHCSAVAIFLYNFIGRLFNGFRKSNFFLGFLTGFILQVLQGKAEQPKCQTVWPVILNKGCFMDQNTSENTMKKVVFLHLGRRNSKFLRPTWSSFSYRFHKLFERCQLLCM